MIIAAGGCSFVWGSELRDSPHGGPNGYSKKTFTAILSRNHQYICVAYPGQGNIEIAEQMINCVENRQVDAVIVCWSWPSRNSKVDSDTEILALQHVLNEKQIPYLFICADNCIKTQNPDIEWDKWFWFPPGDSVGQTCQPRGFYQWAIENKYQVGLENHPLEQAHTDAAELMQGKFNELVKKFNTTSQTGNPISEKTQGNEETRPVHLQVNCMQIYTVGDSFTYGEELENRFKAWPYLLAEKINGDVINDGKPAGSNDYMIRKLIDHVLSGKEKTPDIVVIGWSSPGRIEWADEVGAFDIWPGYRGKLFDADGTVWRHDLSSYIDRFHSGTWLHRRFVSQVLTTKSFLESMGIKYIMVNVVQNEYYKNLTFENHESYTKNIDKKYFIEYGTNGMLEWVGG